MPSVRLYDVRGEKVTFDRAELLNARAEGAHLTDSSLRDVLADDSIWERARLLGTTFRGASLRESSFVKAVYQANFVHDRDISDPQILHAAARRAGLDPLEILSAMTSEPIKEKLREETAIAADLGIFGAPSFVTEDGELFWGNDRLEDALDWAVQGTLRPSSRN